MFSSLGLFQNTQCPRQDSCKRPNCLFSHRKDLPPQPALEIPVEDTLPKRSISELSALVPAKREAPSLRRVSEPGSWTESNGEPPRKIQKVGPSKSPVARVSLPASTSAVSLGSPQILCLFLNEDLERNPNLESECCSVSCSCSCSPGGSPAWFHAHSRSSPIDHACQPSHPFHWLVRINLERKSRLSC